MLNVVVLQGRLTEDPELKQTPNGVYVTSFNIAVDRRYKSGEERQADFFRIVAWRGTAEVIHNYFRKGSLIGIEGTLQSRKYQDSDGNNRTVIEVLASNVHFMESRKSGGSAPSESVSDEETPTFNTAEFEEIAMSGFDSNDTLPF